MSSFLNLFLTVEFLERKQRVGRAREIWGMLEQGSFLFLRVQPEKTASPAMKSNIQCIQCAEQPAVCGSLGMSEEGT